MQIKIGDTVKINYPQSCHHGKIMVVKGFEENSMHGTLVACSWKDSTDREMTHSYTPKILEICHENS